MTDKPTQRMFCITEQQLAALQDYFLNTPMPFKQSQPYVQMLTSLPEVNVTPGSESVQVPKPSNGESKAEKA